MVFGIESLWFSQNDLVHAIQQVQGEYKLLPETLHRCARHDVGSEI